MLYINPNKSAIQGALIIHHRHISCAIRKKVGSDCGQDNCWVCSSKIKPAKAIPPPLASALSDDSILRKLIRGKPAELLEVNSQLWDSISINCAYVEWLELSTQKKSTLNQSQKNKQAESELLIKTIQKIVDYRWFSSLPACGKGQYSAYALAERLDMRSCTYCNRVYTSTMVTGKGKKVMRPQFDHWFPQSKYPFLALSFFNLIPSCNICNSSNKGSALFNPGTNIHPYLDLDPTDGFFFSYGYDGVLGKYKIHIHSLNPGNRKAENTLKALHIDTMYEAHQEELADLIRLSQAYTKCYTESLQGLFPHNTLSRKEVYRLAFGTESETTQFHKRPLSKFKRDILDFLGVT